MIEKLVRAKFAQDDRPQQAANPFHGQQCLGQEKKYEEGF